METGIRIASEELVKMISEKSPELTDSKIVEAFYDFENDEIRLKLQK